MMLRALALLPALLFPAIAAAAEPVQVSADNLVINEAEQIATFTGNVVIGRTGLTVWADKVVVVYAGGISDIKSFDATGRVRIQTKDQLATGERAEFNPETQLLLLTGNVAVDNASGKMRGAELLVNLATNDSVFRSGAGQRVTGVFTPQ